MPALKFFTNCYWSIHEIRTFMDWIGRLTRPLSQALIYGVRKLKPFSTWESKILLYQKTAKQRGFHASLITITWYRLLLKICESDSDWLIAMVFSQCLSPHGKTKSYRSTRMWNKDIYNPDYDKLVFAGIWKYASEKSGLANVKPLIMDVWKSRSSFWSLNCWDTTRFPVLHPVFTFQIITLWTCIQ